ncbi:hypothetical protein SAMN05421858_3745 [Haladaptatus litoreus]|uniref:Uncharacterized protein n=1 Tax=Haladaptatus litoreus TaxID=553468 RepID=A0A1N7DM74_9EURY|nr:hypothetical protein SAMN05421858_3745 [Haladaptatus litoreus]
MALFELAILFVILAVLVYSIGAYGIDELPPETARLLAIIFLILAAISMLSG